MFLNNKSYRGSLLWRVVHDCRGCVVSDRKQCIIAVLRMNDCTVLLMLYYYVEYNALHV